LLGDEHNLVVLCEELSSDATICRGPIDVDRLRLAADHDQCRLREKARARVRYIYDHRSGALRSRYRAHVEEVVSPVRVSGFIQTSNQS